MGLNLVGLNVVSDSDRADELSAFYERLLGWARFPVDEFTALCNIEQKGFPTWITFQQVGDYVRPVWPATPEEQQMAHLDFHVKDVDEAVNYALSCGATASETQCDDGWRGIRSAYCRRCPGCKRAKTVTSNRGWEESHGRKKY